jgi:hypothetical protein
MARNPPGTDDGVKDRARIMRYAASLAVDFPGDGSLDFVSSGYDGAAYSTRVSKFDWGVFYDRQGGGTFIDELRADMRANYDYVLVDSRTGLSDTAGICTVALPDALVNCFTMSTQSIDGAVMITRSVRGQAQRDMRILPVPMRIEDAEKTKLEAGRDYARSRFAGFLTDMDHDGQERYWGEVEVPYKTFYAYEEILATIADRPRQGNTLLASYERIAAVLTDRRVTELEPLPEPERRRRLADFERTKPPVPSDVFVTYAEQDRMWAEWIAHQVAAAGFTVIRQGSDLLPGADVRSEVARAVGAATCTVVVLTPDYVESPNAMLTWDTALDRDPSGQQGLLLPILVTDYRPQGVFAARVPVNLAGLNADQAREELLASLQEPISGSSERPGPVDVQEGPRFPGEEPKVFHQVPLRNPNFVGRDAVLLELRDRLARSSTAAVLPQALHGLGGVGKTQVAAEFAHRFAADYDLVCWVPAEQLAETRSALTALAPQLGIALSDDAGDTLRMVIDALRRGDPYRRWLLVFDNAEDTSDDIQSLFPQQGPGHILVTSRNQDWSAVADTIEVDAFTRDESIQLLTKRARGISAQDADRLAERLGDLPLAIEQAAVWQAETGMPVDEYLRLVDEHLERLLSESMPTNYPTSVAATWRIAFDGLERRSPAALQLLQVCAFFGAEPIPFRLLKLGRYAPSLPSPLDTTISDTILRRRAVREIGRYALARVDPGRDTLMVHRLVQAVLRDRMSPDERATLRTGAHELLGAANPGNPDNAQTWGMHAELSPHIVPSGAIDAQMRETRKLVVDQVRYRYRRSDFESSRELAELARERWVETLGEDDAQTLEVSAQLSDALWGLSWLREARELRGDILRRLRHSPEYGEDHDLTLITANGVGADLRATGDFVDAHRHDEAYLARHRRIFGPEDPKTLRSANNLAADYRLLGDFRSARELDQETFEHRETNLLPSDSEKLSSIVGLARDLIGLGDYRGARALLGDQLVDFRRELGPRHIEVLRATRTYTVAVRKSGAYEEALTAAEDNLSLHQARYGDAHFETLAVMATVSHDRRMAGDLPGARDIGERALDGYRHVLGAEHPFTFVTMSNLAIVLRAMREVDVARSLDELALRGLRRALGDDNPFTLCCVANLANDMSLAGDHAAALRLSEQTVERSNVVRGDRHPYTMASRLNLLLDRVAAGVDQRSAKSSDEVLALYSGALGDDHPEVAAAARGIRAEFDIEPPDL